MAEPSLHKAALASGLSRSGTRRNACLTGLLRLGGRFVWLGLRLLGFGGRLVWLCLRFVGLGRWRAGAAAKVVLEQQVPNHNEGLADDVAGHLGMAMKPLGEDDGDLDDPQP